MHQSFFPIAAIEPGMILRVILISIVALGILTLLINRLIAIWNRIWPVTTVFENYQALHFHRGRFVAQLSPGEYRFRESTNQIDLYDMRESPLIVSGQEVLTSDHLGLKLSLVVQWRFADLLKVSSVVSSHYSSLHADIQATCRQAVETRTCEELLGNRSAISVEVLENLRVKADRYGIEIVDVSIRDFMLPASLKGIYSKVAEARQEGLAALERARGETAALRSLANASRMIASTPGLALLRTLQTVENASGNATVVLPTEFLKFLNSSTTDAPDHSDKNSGNS